MTIAADASSTPSCSWRSCSALGSGPARIHLSPPARRAGRACCATVVPVTPARRLPAAEFLGQFILVAARGWTPALQFALEESRVRGAQLLVLYIREVAVNIDMGSNWQDDPDAKALFARLEAEAQRPEGQQALQRQRFARRHHHRHRRHLWRGLRRAGRQPPGDPGQPAQRQRRRPRRRQPARVHAPHRHRVKWRNRALTPGSERP